MAASTAVPREKPAAIERFEQGNLASGWA